MKDTDPDQIPLFEPPPDSVVVTFTRPRPAATDRYSRYRPKSRVLCTDCIRDIHERGWNVAPPARGSVWRCTRADGEVVTLCDAHCRARKGEPV